MKYMLMMFGDASAMREVRSSEWITEMIAFMHALNAELASRGELVEARGLDDPQRAKMLTRTADGIIVTDGPFAEAKESLAGYWVLDVEDEARVIEVATRIVTYAGRVEFRLVPDGRPEQ